MSLFGTSGIRDICPQIISPALAMVLGNIFASGAKTIAVGYDSRQSGQMLSSALSSGAMQSGADVHNLGICATPTLCLYTKQNKCLGAMITASHNPPQYNGIKLFENGAELASEKEKKIESALLNALKHSDVQNGNLASCNLPSFTQWQKCGQIFQKEQEAKNEHLSLLLSSIDVKLIKSKRPKIVLDCANMAACSLMPTALKEAGCEVIELNCKYGPPYERDFEPSAKTLSSLCSKIKKTGANLGIAHDGDADRAIIADENGVVLGLDAQLVLATSSILQKCKNKTVVSTVESSLSLKDAADSACAKLLITPVGSLHVAREMKKQNACFGGEPCGEYIFENGAGSPDGLAAGLFFTQLFCKEGKLSTLASKIRTYPIERLKIKCANEKKKFALEQIKKQWPFDSPSFADGIRSDCDWGWVLVRPSGTESYMRITMEARQKEILSVNLAKIEKIVKSCVI